MTRRFRLTAAFATDNCDTQHVPQTNALAASLCLESKRVESKRPRSPHLLSTLSSALASPLYSPHSPPTLPPSHPHPTRPSLTPHFHTPPPAPPEQGGSAAACPRRHVDPGSSTYRGEQHPPSHGNRDHGALRHTGLVGHEDIKFEEVEHRHHVHRVVLGGDAVAAAAELGHDSDDLLLGDDLVDSRSQTFGQPASTIRRTIRRDREVHILVRTAVRVDLATGKCFVVTSRASWRAFGGRKWRGWGRRSSWTHWDRKPSELLLRRHVAVAT